MSRAKDLLVFASGVAIGSLVTWKLLKTKYELIAAEEIESVKEAFSNRYAQPETTEEIDDARAKADAAKEKPSIDEYASKLQNLNYAGDREDDETAEEEDEMDKPYVISPDEFGERSDYETVSLTYFDDKILVDDNNEVIEDVEGLVGVDSLNRFGEFEDDSVFVRNDAMKTDFEILYDLRKYSELDNEHEVTED